MSKEDIINKMIDISEISKYYDELSNSGIYGIFINKYLMYIGQSTNLFKRFKEHISFIKVPNNEIKYKYLNKYYNKQYNIEFSIAEFCTEELLKERESYYINTLLPFLNTEVPSYNNRNSWIKTVVDYDELFDEKFDEEFYCYINCSRNFVYYNQLVYECDYALHNYKNIKIIYDTKYNSRSSYKKSLDMIKQYSQNRNYKIIEINSKSSKFYELIEQLKNNKVGIINFSNCENNIIKTLKNKLNNVEIINICYNDNPKYYNKYL